MILYFILGSLTAFLLALGFLWFMGPYGGNMDFADTVGLAIMCFLLSVIWPFTLGAIVFFFLPIYGAYKLYKRLTREYRI